MGLGLLLEVAQTQGYLEPAAGELELHLLHRNVWTVAMWRYHGLRAAWLKGVLKLQPCQQAIVAILVMLRVGP